VGDRFREVAECLAYRAAAADLVLDVLGGNGCCLFRRGPDGRRRVVGRRTRHVCIVPPRIVQQVTLTYAIAG